VAKVCWFEVYLENVWFKSGAEHFHHDSNVLKLLTLSEIE
jgi:hypothetical protein